MSDEPQDTESTEDEYDGNDLADLTWLPGLPEGWTPLSSVWLVRCLDEDGHPAVFMDYSEELAEWEVKGLLGDMLDRLRAGSPPLFVYYQGEDDEGEEEL